MVFTSISHNWGAQRRTDLWVVLLERWRVYAHFEPESSWWCICPLRRKFEFYWKVTCYTGQRYTGQFVPGYSTIVLRFISSSKLYNKQTHVFFKDYHYSVLSFLLKNWLTRWFYITNCVSNYIFRPVKTFQSSKLLDILPKPIGLVWHKFSFYLLVDFSNNLTASAQSGVPFVFHFWWIFFSKYINVSCHRKTCLVITCKIFLNGHVSFSLYHSFNNW